MGICRWLLLSGSVQVQVQQGIKRSEDMSPFVWLEFKADKGDGVKKVPGSTLSGPEEAKCCSTRHFLTSTCCSPQQWGQWDLHMAHSVALMKHSKLCFQRAKLLFLYKRPDQRFSYRWELRSKSDYFQRNPPFSTCQLTMSVPLCHPWKALHFGIMEAGCILLLLLPFILAGEMHTLPPHSFRPFFKKEKSGPHAPEERKVL